ncbi:phospholipase D-like domain-containing protein [Nitratireductor basaltis]|uniref:Phospholipase D n=1 Tax=Nitratireductor basaltis TaxID=472175 RepID=A0A084U595_9HYPH|nr:phospholipase D-like domain-containing protein [Nitratireductor basaltis]KFB08131.1 Phosphatidylserine/phosphatidylglycerophosphate/ cardiolipin synthase [Nitratireductor basaltis]
MATSSVKKCQIAEGTSAATLDRYRHGLETALGIPFTAGNAIDVYRNGDEIFPPMLDAISRSEEMVELLTFIYWKGDIAEKFVEVLSERARAGVTVRVLLDGFGARPMPQRLVERMEDAGVQVRWFRPLPQWKVWNVDNRTHRKILVCDGQTGFTGGVGIAAEWEGHAQDSDHWRETHFRVRGPSVPALRAAFYQDWVEAEYRVDCALERVWPSQEAGDTLVQVLASTASVGFTDIAILHEALVLLARKRLRITTPYFAPHERDVEVIVDAARRGVDIEIILPGPHIDKRVSELAASDDFEPLFEAGVKIWRYQPTMIHTKLVTVDGMLSCIGSANFNQRSSSKDDEIALCVLDPAFTQTMDSHFDEDRQNSVLTTLEDWKRRGMGRRARETVARLMKGET